MKKLKHKFVKEKKGAIRELRKDATFIAAEKSKKRKLDDEERAEKGKKIMAMLELEQHDMKEEKREKEKMKKRRF
jgi:nucleolar protein 14